MAQKTTDRTDTIEELQRELVEHLSKAVIGSAETVKEYFDSNATSIVLASLGLNNSFGRIEVQRSNGFMSAFADVIKDMAVTRARALVNKHAPVILDEMTRRRDKFADRLIKMAEDEYERALIDAVNAEFRRVTNELSHTMMQEMTAAVSARVKAMSPEFIGKLRSCLIDDVLKGTDDAVEWQRR